MILLTKSFEAYFLNKPFIDFEVVFASSSFVSKVLYVKLPVADEGSSMVKSLGTSLFVLTFHSIDYSGWIEASNSSACLMLMTF